MAMSLDPRYHGDTENTRSLVNTSARLRHGFRRIDSVSRASVATSVISEHESALMNGIIRMRSPVSAAIAFATAGAIGGSGGLAEAGRAQRGSG